MITLQFSGNATTGQVKEITHAGRRYLVSPVVALREGILNDTFVSAAEFGKFASSWQGRPVPISHPKAEGGYTSANTPDIWANDVLGHLWNVAVDNGALKGEIWIDLDKAQMMGERASAIVNRLRRGDAMEVSTGYFCEMEATPGQFNGLAYGGIARNIRPDHLALLPDEVGACSWADGCGTPRVNAAEEQPMDEQGLFQRFLGWLKNDQSQNLDPTVNAEGTVSAPTSSCEPAEGQIALEPNISTQERSMNKTELIGALVANAQCKFAKERLATWDESDLTALQQSMAVNEEEASTETAAEATPAAATVDGAALPAEITQFAEMIRGLGGMDKLAQALGNLTANQNEERSGLISGIVANCRGAFKQGDLTRFDTNQLRDIYGSYLPRDYSANAGTLRQGFGPEEEELLMVWPQFAKKEG